MTRSKTQKKKYGYHLETSICLTPDLAENIHHHATIHIDNGTDSIEEPVVLEQAYNDFNALLTHLTGQDIEMSNVDFMDSLISLELYERIESKVWESFDDEECATHEGSESVQ